MYQIDYGLICSCKVPLTVIYKIYIGIGIADLSYSQFQYTHNHNELVSCFVARLFISVTCDNAVKL